MSDPSELLSFPVTFVLGVLRILWWLAWDVCFQIVGWSVGWPICRLVSLGRFPVEPFSQLGGAEDFTAFMVEVVGLLTIAAAIWYLSGSWPL